ncbi:MAG: hypothetical protein JWL96_3638, partial [Sphingomonas bacterium]|uniref:hypothetical protein n=1 Tax=Sphingomonas bacterium TaxID=1895847 RepID=UPI00262A907B
PSLINNIRLFAGDRSRYLEGHEEAVAYGRRLAWLLNSEGFSLGVFPELYVLFTSSLEPGFVRVTDDGGDWWHRYVHIGATGDFPNSSDALDVIANGIVEALIAVRPDEADAIRRADLVVREHGDGLRFLLKRRDMAKLVAEISFNIGAWPKPSNLFIAHIDKATDIYREPTR